MLLKPAASWHTPCGSAFDRKSTLQRQRVPIVMVCHAQSVLNSNSSMTLPDGSSSRMARPAPPSLISPRNRAPAWFQPPKVLEADIDLATRLMCVSTGVSKCSARFVGFLKPLFVHLSRQRRTKTVINPWTYCSPSAVQSSAALHFLHNHLSPNRASQPVPGRS